MKPRLLDLYCGAGGAAVGYHRAGFDVVGVDIADQPHYPFDWLRGDALAVLRDMPHVWREFDAIHASPPCQAYSTTRTLHTNEYPDLIGPTRELLYATGLPFVIENVPGAPLISPYRLCGSGFGLGVWRHRCFECWGFGMGLIPPCSHREHPEPIDVTGTGGRRVGDRDDKYGGEEAAEPRGSASRDGDRLDEPRGVVGGDPAGVHRVVGNDAARPCARKGRRVRRLLLVLACTLTVAWACAERADGATCQYPKVAKRLDAYLHRVGSPAAGQGCAIAEEAIRGGIHPVFVVAVAGTESSYWIHGCTGNRWNGFGLSSCGPGWYVPPFATLRHAVRFFIRFVNQRFPGATTPYSFRGYAACTECWAAKTTEHMRLMGYSNAVRWPWPR